VNVNTSSKPPKNTVEHPLMNNLADKTELANGREEIDPVFKEVLSFCFGRLNVPLQTQYEVSRIARTMDVLVLLEQNEELERVRAQTPFNHFREHNQVELKAIRDPLTIAGYHLILGRTHLYLGEHNISPSQMTVTIVCARKPRKVLYDCEDHVIFDRVENAHYVSQYQPPVHIIVINELAIIEKNYPLLLFASSEQIFRNFLERTLEEENLDYVRYAYAVRPQITKEVLVMAGRHRLSKEDLRFIVNDIGDELLPLFSPEDRLRGLSPRELIKYLSPRELIKHLSPRELIKYLSVEEQKLLKQLLEELEKKS